jgi:hypothetical protein
VATEAAWLGGENVSNEKNVEKSKKTLDRDRPSHGRVATEAAWLGGENVSNEKNVEKSKKTLDRDRPSHGRT